MNATPDEVMAVIADFEAYPDWAQGVKTTEIRKRDSKGRGSEVYFHVSSMGLEAKYVLRYRHRARGLSWTTVEASGAVKDIEGEYDLEADGEGTTVTYRLTMDPAISLPGFLRRQAERTIVGTALGGLKKRVESG